MNFMEFMSLLGRLYQVQFFGTDANSFWNSTSAASANQHRPVSSGYQENSSSISSSYRESPGPASSGYPTNPGPVSSGYKPASTGYQANPGPPLPQTPRSHRSGLAPSDGRDRYSPNERPLPPPPSASDGRNLRPAPPPPNPRKNAPAPYMRR